MFRCAATARTLLTPYVDNEVAAGLPQEIDKFDDRPGIAALLHDAIEDQNISAETIASEFGERVAEIVMEVTDDKSLSKDVRKRKQVERTHRRIEEKS